MPLQIMNLADMKRVFSNSPLSLRAKRGNLMPTSEIAELVPSETRNLMLQFASATPRNR
jgi:hypothetical protein